MDFFTVILIGAGLAMDCFAVSVSQGIANKKLISKYSLLMGFLFGHFQASMLFIGYSIGKTFAALMESVDHWIAFVILGFIGGKMIYESLKKNKETEEKATNFKNRILLLLSLALATSIDALASGLIFVPYPDRIWDAVHTIGISSVIFSIAGNFIGAYFGKKFRLNVEMVGGLVLIGIGIKILLEHTVS